MITKDTGERLKIWGEISSHNICHVYPGATFIFNEDFIKPAFLTNNEKLIF
jgi:hypothetical protein